MKRGMFVFVCLFALAFSASAVPLTYNGYLAGINDGQLYVGIASGTLGGQSIDMWCIDSTRQILASTWEVNPVNLSNPVGLEGLLGLAVDDYKAMVLIAQQFTGTSLDVDLQHIIWNQTNPSAYPLSVSQQAQWNNALAEIGNRDWSNAYVLLPIGKTIDWAGQPFETGFASAVPEPATMALIGGGLLALGFFRRKLSKSKS